MLKLYKNALNPKIEQLNRFSSLLTTTPDFLMLCEDKFKFCIKIPDDKKFLKLIFPDQLPNFLCPKFLVLI